LISISSNKENGFKPDHEANINVIGNDIWFTGDISLVAMSDLIKEIQVRLNNKDVTVVGTSKLCSSATYFLFTKCDTFVYPNMYALFHPMNFEFNDNQQAVSKRNGFYKRLIRMVNDIYKSKNFRCNWNTTDTYLYANDLIKKGIIEGIWRTI